MNIKVLATAMTAIGCGLAMTIVSCNSDSETGLPSNPSHGPKSPQMFSGNCNVTLPVTRCPAGAAALSYNGDNGSLTATNLNGITDGISSTFDPAHNWLQAVDANLPTAGQRLTATAYNGGAEESELNVIGTAASQVQLAPTFLAGSGGRYSIEVYNNGQLAGSQADVHSGTGPTVAALGKVWRWIKFHVRFTPPTGQKDKGTHINNVSDDNGTCVWEVSDDRGPAATITLPDNTQVVGNEIRFIETVDGQGRYPYHSVDQVDVTTNIGTYTVISEYAGG